MERVTIDIVSDIVCPWCYLGKARMELAVAEVQDEIGVDINCVPTGSTRIIRPKASITRPIWPPNWAARTRSNVPMAC